MPSLRQIEEDILATGKIDTHQLDVLRRQVYAAGKIGREKADFLVALHKRVEHPTLAFEHFFYGAVKDHILADGQIGAEEAAWLGQMLFADGEIDDQERKFMHELNGAAVHVSCEFEELFKESMEQPQE